MRAKLSLDVFRRIAEERGGRCLSTEYVGACEKLQFECSAGHVWSTTGSNIRSGRWCSRCAGNVPLSLKVFQDLAAERGGRCLSAEYKNIREHLSFECREGHRWVAIPANVKNAGAWCPYCAGSSPLTLQTFKDLAKARGGRCISSEYKNSRGYLGFVCSEGHHWEAVASTVKNAGTWCPHCYGTPPLTLQVFKDLASDRGGRCLSTIYKTNKDRLKFECREGHRWESSASSIKNANSWCPHCVAGLGEKEAISFIQRQSGLAFKKARPSWLRYKKGWPLELDGYCDSAFIAVEYQGRQHFEYIQYFHESEAAFHYQQEKDRWKAAITARHGILLLVILGSNRTDPASIHASVVMQVEASCIPLFGVNREFTEMVLSRGRRFSACVLSAAVGLLCWG